jgi:hypothetical protein
MSKAMSRLPPLGWKAWIIAVLLPWLAGCSALQFTYHQADSLAYW